MDREMLLYAMGEVDEDVLCFRYHLKQVMLALVMGLLTMVTCLYIAERFLGVSGHVEFEYNEMGKVIAWSVNPNYRPGLWFRGICLVVIPLLFAWKVRWRYTWVNLFLFFGLYFPMRFHAEPWPVMGYMGTSDGILEIPWINPFVMMVHFWGVQSLVYLVYNIAAWLYRKWKRTDQSIM